VRCIELLVILVDVIKVGEVGIWTMLKNHHVCILLVIPSSVTRYSEVSVIAIGHGYY
jgi:hypothetical protein